MSSKSVDAITHGIDTSTKNLLMFIPSFAPVVVQLLFLVLAYVVFPYQFTNVPFITGVVAPNTWLVWAGNFIAGLVGFLAYCMVVDMTHDSITGQPVDLNKSLNVVMGRLAELIIIAIISVLCAITILLIPLALFFRTIAIIEKTDTNETITKTVDFVRKNLGEVLVFVIIVIIVTVILFVGFSLIPFGGAYVSAVLNGLVSVVLTAATVHFYISLRSTPPPPTSSPNP